MNKLANGRKTYLNDINGVFTHKMQLSDFVWCRLLVRWDDARNPNNTVHQVLGFVTSPQPTDYFQSVPVNRTQRYRVRFVTGQLYSINSLSSREAKTGILSSPALFNASFTDFEMLSLVPGFNTTSSIKSIKSIGKKTWSGVGFE